MNNSEVFEWKVFECLCKEYNCLVLFLVIFKCIDLFIIGFKDVEFWFWRRNGSFLILENLDGVIIEVCVFFVKVWFCFSYNVFYGICIKDNCLFLYVCRDYIIDFCVNGVICLWNY